MLGDVDTPGPRLHRVLGPLEVTASGVGIIIGAGIYVLLGAATARAGAAVWLSFVFAGALSALTALSYAELASMFPKSSAEYEYTRQVAPAGVAFLVGWLMTIGMLIAAAAVSLGFANYVNRFVRLPHRGVAVCLLAAEALLAAGGIARSTKVTVLLSLVQVAGLVAVIAIGVPHLGRVNLLHSHGMRGVLGGAALVFFAFIGFDEVITLSEETRDPTRTVPRALLLALGISTLLYVAVAIASVGVIGADALGASPRPLADVMADALGSRAADWVAVIATLSTLNTSILALTAGSRLLYGMATSGAMPRQLGRVHERTGVPLAAVLVSAAIAIGFVAIGNIELIAGVTDFAIYLVFIAVNLAVVLLRLRRPDVPRPFRIPGSVGRIPVAPVLGLLAVAVMAPQLDVDSLLIGAAVTAVGAIAWFAFGSRSSGRGGASSGNAVPSPNHRL